MRLFLLIMLFFFGAFKGVSQDKKTVVVSDWINEPSSADLTKSLVFIDFWATWCGPCIHSMTYTQELQKEFGGSVLFVYMSDENPDKIRGFMKVQKKTFFSATDETRKNIDEYSIFSLPRSVVLGPKGEVLWQGNPTDMKRPTLKRLIDRFNDQKGNMYRFKVLPKESKEITTSMFLSSDDTLWYEIDTSGVKLESHEGGVNTVSGDVSTIMGYIYNVPSYQIDSDSVKLAYSFSNKSSSDSIFKSLILSFFKSEYKIDTVLKNQGVYVITEGDSSSFLDQSFYNYELGYMAFMEDGVSLMIDDASSKDAFKLLSNISSYPFLYEGMDDFVYDWSFFFGRRESLFDQLTNELGFRVSYSKKELTTYKISPK